MKTMPKPTYAGLSNLTSQGASRSTLRPGQLFFFPEGVLAFEHARQFVFLCKPETAPFIFMRALEPAYLGFVCIDPFLICPDYQPRISDADAAFLELNTPDEALLLSVVNPAPDVRQTTANLQGPMVINLRTGRGRQILCENQNYPVRYAIWNALEQRDADTCRTPMRLEEPVCSAA